MKEYKIIRLRCLLACTMAGVFSVLSLNAAVEPYKNSRLKPEERAADLLGRMTVEEKIGQLQSAWALGLAQKDGSFVADEATGQKRNLSAGNYRSDAHFAHQGAPLTPGKAVAFNEALQRAVIAHSRLGIPALIHEEACHGALWCSATSFPVPIALAASWDADLVGRAYEVVARETRVAAIRQVLAPVVNIARDPRWGRVEETFGEDTCLCSRMAVACVRAFEQQGIVATPKHFVCNYGDGGRDSNAPEIGWREAREVYLPPFKACVQEAGARGIMAAYNSFDGVPCHCNRKLLTDILRREWGFKGIVVSDYGGVEGIENAQDTAVPHGPFRRAIEAGLEVALPDSGGRLAVNMKSGDKDADALDRAVLRVLRLKFELGLFENPFGDAAEADRIVRCQAHRDLALEAARKSMVLLKNKNGVLPLKKDIKTLGVFGSAARKLQLGGYSAPYGCDGKREGAVTAFDGLGKALPAGARLVESLADVKQCETVLYFVDINEGEGSDRSDCGLSAAQEDEIQTLAASGVPIVVVMFNGSAVTMRRWVDKVDAVLEAWYPGEQGGTAVAEALFGWLNPAGRLPITFPKSEGQMPLYYNQKPSGRGYGYVGDDGKPLFPFGYGLSYTKFVYSDLVVGTPKVTTGEAAKLSVRVANTGDRDGDEVVQLYIHLPRRSVVTPLKELKGFKRVTLKPGAAQTVEFTLGPDDLSVWDANMKWVNEPGHVEIMVGGSSEDIRLKGEFEVHSK